MSYTREEAKLSVEKGWGSLIDIIYDRLEEDDTVTQVKEKWGTLRFYCFTSEEVLDFIDTIEEVSGTICEFCGEDGSLVSLNGWYKTLCPDCHNDFLDTSFIE